MELALISVCAQIKLPSETFLSWIWVNSAVVIDIQLSLFCVRAHYLLYFHHVWGGRRYKFIAHTRSHSGCLFALLSLLPSPSSFSLFESRSTDWLPRSLLWEYTWFGWSWVAFSHIHAWPQSLLPKNIFFIFGRFLSFVALIHPACWHVWMHAYHVYGSHSVTLSTHTSSFHSPSCMYTLTLAVLLVWLSCDWGCTSSLHLPLCYRIFVMYMPSHTIHTWHTHTLLMLIRCAWWCWSFHLSHVCMCCSSSLR